MTVTSRIHFYLRAYRWKQRRHRYFAITLYMAQPITNGPGQELKDRNVLEGAIYFLYALM